MPIASATPDPTVTGATNKVKADATAIIRMLMLTITIQPVRAPEV